MYKLHQLHQAHQVHQLHQVHKLHQVHRFVELFKFLFNVLRVYVMVFGSFIFISMDYIKVQKMNVVS